MEQKPKLLVIGMGHIGQYLAPCYQNLLGADMGSRMLGLKATATGLPELQQKFSFPIQAGGIDQALARLEPDIILISTKPQQIPAIVRDSLRPYLDRRRAQGLALPDLYSFAPSPTVTELSDQLGGGVNVVNIIPNMVDRVGELYVAPLSYTMLTFDPRRPWPPARRQLAFDFFTPIGRCIDIAADTVHFVLAAKISCHNLYEICLNLSETLTGAGRPVQHQAIASAGRAYLRARFDSFATDIYHCADGAIEQPLRQLVRELVYGWYDGIIEFCLDNGVDDDVSGSFVRSVMELHLLTIQLESRQALLRNNSQHATKGGVLENSIRCFGRDCAPLLERIAANWRQGDMDDELWANWRRAAYELTAITAEHGRKLTRE